MYKRATIRYLRADGFCDALKRVQRLQITPQLKIIRPHRNTTCILDAAYCYRRIMVVCPSVCLCRSACLSRSWAPQKTLNRSRCRLGCGLGWVQLACSRWGCTLAPPGEYDWTVHVRRRCALFVKLVWPLVLSLRLRKITSSFPTTSVWTINGSLFHLHAFQLNQRPRKRHGQ